MATQTSTVTTASAQRSKTAAVVPRSASFFPLGVVGLSAPPLVVPAIPLLLFYTREIPFWDVFFSVAFPVYLCLANRFRFDNNSAQVAARERRGEAHPEKPEWFPEAEEPWFAKYMIFAATLGVVLPLLVQFAAPSPIAEATAPHLFVLLCQIMMELMVNGPRFHPMLQLITPIGFSAYRMAGLTTWLAVAWEMVSSAHRDGGSNAISAWEAANLLLAASNMIFWTYNTFVMKLLRQLPLCLDEGKFPDASITWKYQLVPAVNPSDPPKVKD